MRPLVIVDDSGDQVELIRLALDTLGLRRPVESFRCGEDCLSAMEHGLAPGLVLLDVNMPGLDGPDTAARIRRLSSGRATRIVMMSTSDQSSDVRRGLEGGVNSYVMKPTGQQTWTDVLLNVIDYWYGADLGEDV